MEERGLFTLVCSTVAAKSDAVILCKIQMYNIPIYKVRMQTKWKDDAHIY